MKTNTIRLFGAVVALLDITSAAASLPSSYPSGWSYLGCYT